MLNELMICIRMPLRINLFANQFCVWRKSHVAQSHLIFDDDGLRAISRRRAAKRTSPQVCRARRGRKCLQCWWCCQLWLLCDNNNNNNNNIRCARPSLFEHLTSLSIFATRGANLLRSWQRVSCSSGALREQLTLCQLRRHGRHHWRHVKTAGRHAPRMRGPYSTRLFFFIPPSPSSKKKQRLISNQPTIYQV